MTSRSGAHEQIRTADRLLTMQVLYLLSYVGSRIRPSGQAGAGNGVRTRDPQLGRLMLYQLSYSRSESSQSRLAGPSVEGWWGGVDSNHRRH